MIRAIAAVDDRLGIAAQGAIPWRLTDDLRYFRRHTRHHTVLMGSKTYETLAGPLPDRQNVVVSRSLRTVRPGFVLVRDAATFLRTTDEEVWIIGGAGLYAATIHFCDELYITRVEGDFGCDRFFPVFEHEFELRNRSSRHVQGNQAFTYEIYTLKNR